MSARFWTIALINFNKSEKASFERECLMTKSIIEV